MAERQSNDGFSTSAESYFEAQQRRMMENIMKTQSNNHPVVNETESYNAHTTSEIAKPRVDTSALTVPTPETGVTAEQAIPRSLHKTVHYDDLRAASGLNADPLSPTSSTGDSYRTTTTNYSTMDYGHPRAAPAHSDDDQSYTRDTGDFSQPSTAPPKTIQYEQLRAATGLTGDHNSPTSSTSGSYQTPTMTPSTSTVDDHHSRDTDYHPYNYSNNQETREVGTDSVGFGAIEPLDHSATQETNSLADTRFRQSSDVPRKPVTFADQDFDDGVMRADPTHYGQYHSDRRPAANIAQLREHEAARQDASKRYFDRLEGDPGTGARDPVVRPGQGPADQEPTANDGTRSGATEDVPIGAEKSNVLFHPTPEVNLSRVFDTLEEETRQITYVIFGAIIVLDWLFVGGGIRGLLKSLFPASGVAVMVYFILQRVGQNARKAKIAKGAPKQEKLKYVPESVEWMNTLVNTLWHTLQQDFFDNIAHTIDDTIKPYIPAGVPATVKITDLGHGTRAVRVLSMRSLPDSEFGDLVPQHGIDKSGSAEQAKAREKRVEQEQGGVFYNLEIAVAYHAPPLTSRKEQMHVDILAMLGPVPLPVFVEVKEFVATMRIRLQMHPDLPFLKNITFALTENPKVSTSVAIGAPWMFNILNLPVIDTVLAREIDAVASEYVQPKSMSMDMTIYVGGSDQKEDTEAVGVLFVKIHRARRLARQDRRGPGADPYLTIAFSKYEKPMYATRIIKGDRNPVWEETAIIMIRPEHVKRKENVLLRLWDSDTNGADDISGVCEFPLEELVLSADKMHKREDELQGDVAGTDAEGVLEWEIGYFPRAKWEKALRTDATNPKDRHGEKKEVSEDNKELHAQNVVPDPNLPSGILGITIHQLINVQVDNPGKKSMGQVTVQYQDEDGEEGDEEKQDVEYIPSLYVTCDVNDELIYRTRVKNISSAPTLNSSTEQYIRDWRLATVTFSVWDTRKKTDDALVGVAALKMSDIFFESSSVVKFYDLKGGEGSGRIRVSMIFRSMKMKLERSLLGYSVGTFVINSPIVAMGDMKTSKLKLRVSGSKRAITYGPDKSGDHATWSLKEHDQRLPVHFRYLSPVILEFVGMGLTEKLSGPLGKDKHYAVLWLLKLVDNQPTAFTLPIFKTDNPNRLMNNVVSEADETMSLEKVGEVRFDGVFNAGIDASHEEFIGSHEQWSSFQSWKAARASGQRGDLVNNTVHTNVKKLAANMHNSQAIQV